MRWVLAVAVVVFLVSCGSQAGGGLGPAADPANVPDIAGSHFVAGVDPSGAAYGGRVLITQGSTSDTYHLAWTVSGSLQEGNGRMSGNVLEVDWSSDGGATGGATYTVTVEGGLRGVRTIDGYDGEGTEEIFAPRE